MQNSISGHSVDTLKTISWSSICSEKFKEFNFLFRNKLYFLEPNSVLLSFNSSFFITFKTKFQIDMCDEASLKTENYHIAKYFLRGDYTNLNILNIFQWHGSYGNINKFSNKI